MGAGYVKTIVRFSHRDSCRHRHHLLKAEVSFHMTGLKCDFLQMNHKIHT